MTTGHLVALTIGAPLAILARNNQGSGTSGAIKKTAYIRTFKGK